MQQQQGFWLSLSLSRHQCLPWIETTIQTYAFNIHAHKKIMWLDSASQVCSIWLDSGVVSPYSARKTERTRAAAAGSNATHQDSGGNRATVHFLGSLTILYFYSIWVSDDSMILSIISDPWSVVPSSIITQDPHHGGWQRTERISRHPSKGKHRCCTYWWLIYLYVSSYIRFHFLTILCLFKFQDRGI